MWYNTYILRPNLKYGMELGRTEEKEFQRSGGTGEIADLLSIQHNIFDRFICIENI